MLSAENLANIIKAVDAYADSFDLPEGRYSEEIEHYDEPNDVLYTITISINIDGTLHECYGEEPYFTGTKSWYIDKVTHFDDELDCVVEDKVPFIYRSENI